MTMTWFITGASRGMGRELVEQVLERGDSVAATLRRPEQLDDLAQRYGDRLWRRALDVTDSGGLVLGSDAWMLMTESLSRRLVEVSAQRDNAATADFGAAAAAADTLVSAAS